ncbi:LTA synthase family protein [Paenibacillus gansuensis]|uniref:LTA synthase family protein n=1 Tax=Paenibacillus gansuensis TaxID=306542 RepID=A0ABW5PF63_9BACL
MKYLPDLKRHALKHALLYLAVLMIWLKTYLTHRFHFDLPVSGWYQELILFINPVSSILVMLGLSLAFVRNRSYIAILIVSMMSGFLLFVNMLYYRFFNDFITLTVLLRSTQLSQLRGSILDLLRPSDFLVFVDSMILFILIYRSNRRSVGVSRTHIICMITCAVILFSLNLKMVDKIRPDLLTRTFDRQIVVKNIGAFNYLVCDTLITARIKAKIVSAGSKDLEIVKTYVESAPKDVLDPKMYGLAKGRNVFLISMESVQSFVLEKKIFDQEITPFLNDLIKNSFYFDQFYHQTGHGKTSDAEFIIDTMLYPLPSGAVFFTHSQNSYYSLPKQLKKNGYYPVVLHGNNKTFWNRDQMYKTIGYERFFSAEDYNITEKNSVGWGLKDIPFFEQSMDKLLTLPQPFYAKLITLTNHHPFELNPEDRLIPQYNSKSKTLNHYIETVRYTDEALKHFFKRIKAAGLYDNSVFILYGDHYGISKKHRKAMAEFLGKEKLTAFDHVQLQQVPLVIHIPGVKGRKMSVVSGQIDLKPTILHLLGSDSVQGLGFGNDLFALNKPQFAVLRDGSFVTEHYIYTGNKCYRKPSGEKTDPVFCEPFRKKQQNHLRYSDKIIYGDLNRFLMHEKS